MPIIGSVNLRYVGKKCSEARNVKVYLTIIILMTRIVVAARQVNSFCVACIPNDSFITVVSLPWNEMHQFFNVRLPGKNGNYFKSCILDQYLKVLRPRNKIIQDAIQSLEQSLLRLK